MVNEKCILFRNDSSKYKKWIEKVNDWNSKIEYLLNKSANIIGINPEDIKNKYGIINYNKN